jgi:hypothetical protein
MLLPNKNAFDMEIDRHFEADPEKNFKIPIDLPNEPAGAFLALLWTSSRPQIEDRAGGSLRPFFMC